jgi:endonuclease/exonuclease/phosphatase family metal-dependent hydrolase
MRYYLLKNKIRETAERARVVGHLMALRNQLDASVPDKDSDNNLLLATWNIRDFGKKNRRGFGERLPESHFYIAEILSRFDFIAVQEVNELPEWELVMDILGPDWSYIATDVTDTRLGGNGERLTYVFDQRKVKFQNIAGEIVLPVSMLISQVTTEVQGEKVIAGQQFNRTPFLASFQSGWFKFDICTVHLYYGAESGPQLQQRIEEISRVAGYLGDRADDSLKRGRALILLGDFNIVHPEHKTMKALLDQDFRLPKSLRAPTNIDRTKYYDQIAFKTDPAVLEYIDRVSQDPKKRNAGVFEIFDNLFTPEMFEEYQEEAAKTSGGAKKNGEDLVAYYLTWRTYQVSDHKPMWVRLNTNDSQAYLEQFRKPE